MSYSTSNPPGVAVSPLVGGTQSSTQPSGPVVQRPGQTWLYVSTDTAATVAGAGYFTNGYDLGMRVGDTLYSTKSDTNATTIHRVTAVVEHGAATVSTTGTPIV